jgi:hypothetical protein
MGAYAEADGRTGVYAGTDGMTGAMGVEYLLATIGDEAYRGEVEETAERREVLDGSAAVPAKIKWAHSWKT